MARILVVGGGIAGTAAALALTKAGLEVTVYESHPDSGEDIGAFLTLASNGMRALAQFDAAGVVARAGFALTTMRLVDDSGTELAKVPLGEPDDSLTCYRCLRRAELAAALQVEARSRGVEVVHGARLKTLTEDAASVTAHFADGRTATGDLLIGADGLNSTVRSLIHPDGTAPHYAGQQVFYGYTTEAAPPTESGRITMTRSNTAAFGYAVSPDGKTYWFARVHGPQLSASEIADTTPNEWRDQLVPLLRRDATPAADIVAATGEQLMVTNAWDLPIGMPWQSGRTLLIGDAAHAASPATGQGASMALEDAVVLAKALRDTASTAEALASYQRLRRPRVEHNIVVSAQLTAGGAPPRTEQAVARADEELPKLLDWASPLPG